MFLEVTTNAEISVLVLGVLTKDFRTKLEIENTVKNSSI